MNKLRCIAASPSLSEELLVNRFRESYDFLAIVVPAHITLMFPFRSCISSEIIQQHVIETSKNIEPFKISTGLAEMIAGNMIALPVEAGSEQLVTLHNCLYSGAFFWVLEPKNGS